MFNFWKKKSPEPTATPMLTSLEAEPVSPSSAESNQTKVAEVKISWRDRLRKTALTRSLLALFSSNPKLDQQLLENLETALLSADVGVIATNSLIEDLSLRMKAREFADGNALLAHLRQSMLNLIKPCERALLFESTQKPFVLLVVGVNGVGKTTTIGKLAHHLKREGASLMLAAADTFRAAAVEQLKTWGERNNVHVVAQAHGADAASVAFDALQSAQAKQVDVLITDTAGRLHTQTGLMDELTKIRRVIQKLDASAPHEVLLVLDGTTGQNAISQLRHFQKAAGVTGLVVTKLDGTAKGGVVFALAKEFALPIRFVGVGESLDDLRPFDATAFVDGLLPSDLNGASQT